MAWRGLWTERVVPLAVEVLPVQGDRGHLLIVDLDLGLVHAGVEFGVDLQAGG